MLARTCLFRKFAFKVNSSSVIAPSRGTTPILSKFEIQRRIELPDYEKDLEIEREKEKLKKIEDFHHSLKSNDANPSNYLKNLKIFNPPAEKRQPVFPNGPIPDVIEYIKEPPRPFITGRLGRNKGSVKKITPLMKKVLGLQIDDAIRVASLMEQRAGKRIHIGLKMVKDHALNKGMNALRLYVKDAITNHNKRIKGIRYHAKGKFGRQKSDWCTLYFKLEEKPAREFFKDVVAGKAPPGVAMQWKEKIMSSPNAFDEIRKYQFILTARGRQQRREMIKRKAYSLQQELLVEAILLEKGVHHTDRTVGNEGC